MASTAHTVWLSVGDGPTDDFLTLSDHVGFNVRQPGPAWPTPDASATTRDLQLPISLYGGHVDALVAKKRAIETKLRQAKKARGPHGIGDGVTLGIRLFGAADAIYLDVIQGGVKIDNLYSESGWAQATLYLTCGALARGDEISVQNLLSYTDDASNGAWVTSSVTVAADALSGPDGSLTADILTPSASDSSIYQQVAGLTAHTSYAFSVWLRTTGAETTLPLELRGSSGTLITSKPIGVSGMWQRFFVAADIGSNTAVRCQIGGSSSWSSGEVLAFWGAQMEPGSFPSAAYLRVGTVPAPVNGDQGWFMWGIPGDAPALLQLAVIDQSSGGKAINGLVIGARSGDDLRIRAYQPVVAFGTGSSGTSGPDASGYLSNGITNTLGSTGASWKELAYAVPADVPYNRGRFDVRARLTDTVSPQPAPSELGGTVTPGIDVATQTPSIGRHGAAIVSKTASSISVSLGGATAAGSTLLAFVYCDGGGSAQLATASGWTSEGVKSFTAADADTNSIQMLKNVNAASISSVTFAIQDLSSFATSATTRVLVIEVQNVTTTPIGQFDYDLGLNDPGASWEATTSPGQLALGIWGAELTTAGAGEWSNGFTEGFDASGTVLASKVIANKGDQVQTKGIGTATTLWAGFRLTLVAATTNGVANAGTLGPMSLVGQVASVDYSGTVSPPSVVSSSVVVTVAGSKITWRWTAPGFGGTSHYRLVLFDGTDYYEFLSDTTSYELKDLAEGVVVTGYPTASGTSFARWRGSVMTTARTERYPGIVTQNTVSGQPELIALGALDFPPAQRLDDGSVPAGTLSLQQSWAGAATNATAADVLWLFPAGNTASLTYTPAPRTAKYVWIYESRNDGTAAGFIRTSGGNDAGTCDVRGRVEVGPVAAHIVVAATEGGNNPNMVDLAYAIAPTIRPRYRDLIGAVS